MRKEGQGSERRVWKGEMKELGKERGSTFVIEKLFRSGSSCKKVFRKGAEKGYQLR